MNARPRPTTPRAPTRRQVPPPPASVRPFVDAIGVGPTVDLLLELGGAEVHFSDAPTARSKLAQAVGQDNARRLGETATDLNRRIPLANRWVAQVLHLRGAPVAEIARRLRVSDTTVRSYVKPLREAPTDDRQLPLL